MDMDVVARRHPRSNHNLRRVFRLGERTPAPSEEHAGNSASSSVGARGSPVNLRAAKNPKPGHNARKPLRHASPGSHYVINP
jgi:hypothetical protein